jgi:uncharacterized protein with FMN-binding domain
MNTTKNIKIKAISYFALSLAIAAVMYAQAAVPATHAKSAVSITHTVASATVAPIATEPTVGFTDGTYTATGDYYVPGGSEQINVTLTLQSGVITNTSATADASRRDSRRYQDAFISKYKNRVIGKRIDQLSLSKVSGASLTTKGFNLALAKIKAEAKS